MAALWALENAGHLVVAFGVFSMQKVLELSVKAGFAGEDVVAEAGVLHRQGGLLQSSVFFVCVHAWQCFLAGRTHDILDIIAGCPCL